jgi:hypothetical protein
MFSNRSCLRNFETPTVGRHPRLFSRLNAPPNCAPHVRVTRYFKGEQCDDDKRQTLSCVSLSNTSKATTITLASMRVGCVSMCFQILQLGRIHLL